MFFSGRMCVGCCEMLMLDFVLEFVLRRCWAKKLKLVLCMSRTQVGLCTSKTQVGFVCVSIVAYGDWCEWAALRVTLKLMPWGFSDWQIWQTLDSIPSIQMSTCRNKWSQTGVSVINVSILIIITMKAMMFYRNKLKIYSSLQQLLFYWAAIRIQLWIQLASSAILAIIVILPKTSWDQRHRHNFRYG